MANKIEEYRDREAASYDNSASSMAESIWMPMGYAAGFNAAIALNLPIKYNNWANSNDARRIYWRFVEETGSFAGADEELYKYWLDNIYKLE